MAGAGELRTDSPPRALRTRRLDRGGRTGFAINVLVLAWVIWLFDAMNNLAPVRQGLALRNGRRILDLERTLHLAPEHALNSWLATRGALSDVVVFWYFVVHIAVTLLVFGWLWWRRPDLLASMRATLVIVNVIALVIFWSFPVAPPRMLPGGYFDLVAIAHHLPVWRLGATALHSNQLCSLPSLHIAWATWSSIAVWRISSRPWLRALAVIYPFITTYAVMATANHYLADAVTGAALTAIVAFAVSRVAARAGAGAGERA